MPNCARMPGAANVSAVAPSPAFSAASWSSITCRIAFQSFAGSGGRVRGRGRERRRRDQRDEQPPRAAATVRAHRADARTHGARGVPRHAQFAPLHRERVEQQQAARERRADAGDELQRLGGLRRADDAHERREHAHRRAARLLEFLAFAEQAVVARRTGVARIEHGDLPVEAQRRARHQRLARGDARGVDRVARREVVAAVEHDVRAPRPAARARPAPTRAAMRSMRTSGLTAASRRAAASTLRVPTSDVA